MGEWRRGVGGRRRDRERGEVGERERGREGKGERERRKEGERKRGRVSLGGAGTIFEESCQKGLRQKA